MKAAPWGDFCEARVNYLLGDSEIQIEVIDLNDSRVNKKIRQSLSASGLKQLLLAFPLARLLVTPTMPEVFFVIVVGCTKSRTYQMPYRSFLGFVSQLSVPEAKRKPEWMIYGF